MTGSELSGRLADLRQMERDGTDTSETQAAQRARRPRTNCVGTVPHDRLPNEFGG